MEETENAGGPIRPKKSLGQNFLTSQRALQDMVAASRAGEGSVVLEIGPGKGALTRRLLDAGSRVVAVEKDNRLIPELENSFSADIRKKKLRIIHADALSVEPKDIQELANGYIVDANIPYYITGQLIRKYLEAELKPVSMTLLVQKEVAERIVAKDGKESVLSMSVKAYGLPRYVGTVKAGSFNPAPNVDSAIIHIGCITTDFFKNFSEKDFFSVLKAGFSQKRKQLRNNLKAIFGTNTEKKIESLGISPSARPEDLALGDWAKLAQLNSNLTSDL